MINSKRQALIAGFVALSVFGALSGCANPPLESNTGSQVADIPAIPQVSATPEVAPEPVNEVGSRSNPLPVGEPGTPSAESPWTWIVGETDIDGWPEIAATNRFNTPPADGNAYLLLPARVTMSDLAPEEGIDPRRTTIEYVSENGRTYGSCGEVLPPPGSIRDVGVMYAGAVADVVACAEVPTAEVSGGAWRFGFAENGDTLWFVGG